MYMSVDRTTPPQIKDFADIHLPSKQTVILDNGIDVNLIPMSRNGANYISVIWHSGTAASKNLAVPPFVPRMMLQGTKTLSAEDIMERFDFLGAFISNAVSTNYSVFRLLSLNAFNSELMELLSDILLHPTFPEERFEALKRKDLAAYDLARSRTSFIVSEEMGKLMSGNEHPYLQPLKRHDIENVTIEQVVSAWNEGISNSGISIFASGDISDIIKENIKEFGSDLRTNHISTSNSIPIPFTPEKPQTRFIEMPASSQSSVAIGIPTIARSHHDYIPLRIAVVALGGYFGSRLMASIREEKGLTYGIQASLLGLREGSYILIEADCDKRYVQKVIDEVFSEMSVMKHTPMGYEEFRKLRSYYMSYIAATADNFKTVGNYYASNKVHDFPDDYFERQLQVLSTITPLEIRDICAKYFDIDNASVVTAGAH